MKNHITLSIGAILIFGYFDPLKALADKKLASDKNDKTVFVEGELGGTGMFLNTLSSDCYQNCDISGGGPLIGASVGLKLKYFVLGIRTSSIALFSNAEKLTNYVLAGDLILGFSHAFSPDIGFRAEINPGILYHGSFCNNGESSCHGNAGSGAKLGLSFAMIKRFKFGLYLGGRGAFGFGGGVRVGLGYMANFSAIVGYSYAIAPPK